MELRIGRHTFGPDQALMMAIVNRTRDSFYDQGATYDDRPAQERVDRVVEEGAEIVDIGGVRAGYGEQVDAAEEIRRTVDLVAAIRAAHPALPISIDTWRASVAREALAAGADVVNDAWGGVDPDLAGVAAAAGAGIVCTHAGGLPPRTRPHRVAYDDVVADIVTRTTALAEAAVAAGVDRERVLIDPGHDFGKNTRHLLEATRRLGELVDTVIFCTVAAPVIGITTAADFLNYVVVGYVYKVLLEVLVMPVTYAVIGWLKRREPTYGETAVPGAALAPQR